MADKGMDVLMVGSRFPGALALLDRLQQRGFRCHFASSLRTATELLMANSVDVVLSDAELPDGTGFRLVNCLSGLPLSAYVCVPVEQGCFWLPAVQSGRDCWGAPAIRPEELARELDALARSSAIDRIAS